MAIAMTIHTGRNRSRSESRLMTGTKVPSDNSGDDVAHECPVSTARRSLNSTGGVGRRSDSLAQPRLVGGTQ